MKQLNEVGVESDRYPVIPVTHISIKHICCKQIKIQKLNKYDVSQYYCVKNLKLFLPDSKSLGIANTLEKTTIYIDDILFLCKFHIRSYL